ncbi:hypothetical protein O3P69_004211 [Scylla paramamosain]|uniref:Uncharacterized protein n=1 Tax=Scylla paramamosain TaxID=85552 RepID=A0AAW0UJT5_SCYPA
MINDGQWHGATVCNDGSFLAHNTRQAAAGAFKRGGRPTACALRQLVVTSRRQFWVSTEARRIPRKIPELRYLMIKMMV